MKSKSLEVRSYDYYHNTVAGKLAKQNPKKESKAFEHGTSTFVKDLQAIGISMKGSSILLYDAKA